MSDEKKDKEFEGPGHFVNALGKSSAYTLGALPVAGALTAGGFTALVKGQNSMLGRGLLATGAVVGGTAPFIGAVKGWRQATRAEKQHDQLLAENDALKAQLDTVKEVASTKSHASAVQERREEPNTRSR